MITLEQAQALATTAVQDFAIKHGRATVEGMSQIEYIKLIECIARTVYRESDGAFVAAEHRDQVLMRLVGAALTALQHHGDRLYTTHQLQRSLHPQQAGQKSLLLEQQFMGREIEDAFHACYDAALNQEPYRAEDWGKLRLALRKLGMKL